MDDKFKKLIKSLPELEPKQSVDSLVIKIIKRELKRLWEKRLAIILIVLSLIFVYFSLRQIIRLAGILDTLGFGRLLFKDFGWIISEKETVLLAFFEAFPIKEFLYLLFLLASLAFSLYILLRKDE